MPLRRASSSLSEPCSNRRGPRSQADLTPVRRRRCQWPRAAAQPHAETAALASTHGTTQHPATALCRRLRLGLGWGGGGGVEGPGLREEGRWERGPRDMATSRRRASSGAVPTFSAFSSSTLVSTFSVGTSASLSFLVSASPSARPSWNSLGTSLSSPATLPKSRASSASLVGPSTNPPTARITAISGGPSPKRPMVMPFGWRRGRCTRLFVCLRYCLRVCVLLLCSKGRSGAAAVS